MNKTKRVKKILRWATRAVLPERMFTEIVARRALQASFDPETTLLPLLARTGIFLDVGANVGSWSVAAAKVFREVHAYEPDIKLAMALKRILPSNVIVHNIALSDHEGVGRFVVPIVEGEELTTQASLEANANVGFDEKVVREVKLATLDSFNLRDIDAIKIDVEGHESCVLDGALKSIDRERPFLIIEIEERHHPGYSEQIIERLLSLGYLCYFLSAGKLEEFQRGTIEKLQPKGGHGGVGYKSENYINNFFFFPKEKSAQIEGMRWFLAH